MADPVIMNPFFVDRSYVPQKNPILWFDEKGNGPRRHACPDQIDDISEWLDRQRLLGLISPEGAAAVERLIGDLG